MKLFPVSHFSLLFTSSALISRNIQRWIKTHICIHIHTLAQCCHLTHLVNVTACCRNHLLGCMCVRYNLVCTARIRAALKLSPTTDTNPHTHTHLHRYAVFPSLPCKIELHLLAEECNVMSSQLWVRGTYRWGEKKKRNSSGLMSSLLEESTQHEVILKNCFRGISAAPDVVKPHVIQKINSVRMEGMRWTQS